MNAVPMAYIGVPESAEGLMGALFPLRSVGRVALDDYLSFRGSRTERERWSLVEGIAYMMPPPTMRHQRIVLNLLNVLNAGLDQARPGLTALPGLGLAPGGQDDFRPEPDVAVVDSGNDDRVWSDRFYLAAEVLSDGNTAALIERKLRAYSGHAACLHVMVIDQKSALVEMRARSNGFEPVRLSRLSDAFAMPEFGVSARLSDIYRHINFGR
jgi:Uma2 family endonuclease